jgi:hypothetical protein
VAGSERVVIIGAGVGGLGAALALGRAGHPVTVLERDALPVTGDAEAPAHPRDQSRRTLAYEAACRREIEPWFHSSVEMDAGGADPATSDSDAPPNPMARVFAAAATDPVIGRGLTRMMNLLTLPSELAADPEFGARVAAIFADPESYPLPPRIGPTRAELLDGVRADIQEAS